ncbi:MAG: hypothetical protein ACK4NT_04865, partial [Candidatus Omnitrophota bacterium]
TQKNRKPTAHKAFSTAKKQSTSQRDNPRQRTNSGNATASVQISGGGNGFSWTLNLGPFTTWGCSANPSQQ